MPQLMVDLLISSRLVLSVPLFHRKGRKSDYKQLAWLIQRLVPN